MGPKRKAHALELKVKEDEEVLVWLRKGLRRNLQYMQNDLKRADGDPDWDGLLQAVEDMASQIEGAIEIRGDIENARCQAAPVGNLKGSHMAFEEIEETGEYKEIYNVAPYYGENERIRRQIAYVLLKVPEPVRNFACQQCVFTSIDESCGTCVQVAMPLGGLAPSYAFWLIQLSERIRLARSSRYTRYSCSLFRYYIAHELAHGYLNHQGYKAKFEVEAERLAVQWGFGPPMSQGRTVIR